MSATTNSDHALADGGGTPASVFIDPIALSRLIQAGAPLVILDIRFRPDGSDGRDRYLAGHLQGAVYVDLANELAGQPQGLSGRRPLPTIGDLQRDARRWGIRQDSTVVVYDDNRNLQAGRAWWVLRWAGIKDVRLLDGGLASWKDAGFGLSQEVPVPQRGNVVLAAGHLPVLDADGAQAIARNGVLLDARGLEAYTGADAVPGQAPQGHIPGALSAPTTAYLNDTGRLRPPEELRTRLATLGADGSRPIGVYCGGGVAAAHQVAVLATLGLKAALFPGSWSAWSSDPARPVATGIQPG